MPSRDIKPRTISRAITPRNIKDIRPKRHLLRPSEKKKRQQQQSNDDDLSWFNSVGGDDSSSVGNRRQFRFGSYDYNEDSDDMSRSRSCSMCTLMKRLFRCLIRICVMIKNGYHRIREMAPQKRRKRFLMLMILICALRSMFTNLDQYTTMFDSNNEKYDSNKPIRMQRRQSRDDSFTTLKGVDKEMNDVTASMFGTPPKTQTKTMGAASVSGTSSLRGLSSSSNHNIGVQQQSKPINASPVMFAGSYSRNSISTGNKMIPSNTMETKVSSQLSSLDDVQQQSPFTNSQAYKSSAVQSGNQYSSGKLIGSSQQQSMSAGSGLRSNQLASNSLISSSQQQTGSGLSGNSNTQLGNKQPLVGSINTNHNSQNRKSSEGLQCEDHGGPPIESDYSEIVYWKDIPTDLSFTSPYYNPQAQEASSSSFWKTKYLTFEMDDAGWNNMRLGFENVVLLAHSTGRTLVLPPKRQLEHGVFDKSGSKVVSFADFYDIDNITKQKGLGIITMEEFLEREGINGHLKNGDGRVIYPPDNQVKFDNHALKPLWDYIRSVSYLSEWHPRSCVLGFPAQGGDEKHLFAMMDDVNANRDGRPFPHYSEFQGKPTNVDAPVIERFREILASRHQLCMYDKNMHDNNQVLHFGADQADGSRLLVPFYSFLFFEDWKHDLWSKRFIRDNLRYNDSIMCLSARIINALRTRARKRTGNTSGNFDAIHIRRGDFQLQFPMTRMDASDILEELKDVVAPGNTLFITTDERDLTFFSSFQEVYDVVFLGGFGNMLSDINPNYFPLVEQIVASRAKVFVGTFYSTFSAYITRLRGYYSVKEKQDGYMTGNLPNTYFLPSKYKKEMSLYQAVHEPLFARAFAVAWRDIGRLDLL